MISVARYLLTLFTLFIGLGFLSGKKGKQQKQPSTQQLSCSAPNRLTGSRSNVSSKGRSSERITTAGDKDDEDRQVGSPTSKTQPITIHSSRKRSSTARTGSAYSLHSTTSAGSGGGHRRLGHGTPHSGSRSILAGLVSGSAGSGPSSTPKSFTKSHEAIWEQAFRNSCR